MHNFLVAKRVLFGSGILLNSSILLSCLIAWASGLLFQSHEQGLSKVLILLLWVIPGLLLWFLSKRKVNETNFLQSQKIKNHQDSLGLLWPLLGAGWATFLALSNGVPFENDFYRYFFEGRAIFLGHNPYLLSPSDLSGHVPFDNFFSIGYPDLSAVYPPLTLLLFSLVGNLSFPTALLIFGLVNGLLLWWFVGFLTRKEGLDHGFLYIMILYLMREMVFQFHFELWPIIFFALGLYERRAGKRFFYYLLSFHLKLIGLIPMAFSGLHFLFVSVFIKERRSLSIKMGVASFLSVVLSLVIFKQVGFFESNGLVAFSKDWYFSPGFLGWFWPLSKGLLEFKMAKVISILTFGIYLITVVFKKRRLLFEDEGLFFSTLTVVTMAGFFYFSPVYNSWYALWPAILMIKARRVDLGVFTLILSPLCYSYFIVGGESWEALTLVHVLVHAPLLLFLISSLHLSSNHKRAIQSPNH